MAKSVITDEGKTEVLRLAFMGNDERGVFNYMALGKEGSDKAQGGLWNEVTNESYQREKTTVTPKDKAIEVSATFDETNFNVSGDGELIKEIGIVNNPEYTAGEIFFCYCEVPNIKKNDSISLQYTVIIEME